MAAWRGYPSSCMPSRATSWGCRRRCRTLRTRRRPQRERARRRAQSGATSATPPSWRLAQRQTPRKGHAALASWSCLWPLGLGTRSACPGRHAMRGSSARVVAHVCRVGSKRRSIPLRCCASVAMGFGVLIGIVGVAGWGGRASPGSSRPMPVRSLALALRWLRALSMPFFHGGAKVETLCGGSCAG